MFKTFNNSCSFVLEELTNHNAGTAHKKGRQGKPWKVRKIASSHVRGLPSWHEVSHHEPLEVTPEVYFGIFPPTDDE